MIVKKTERPLDPGGRRSINLKSPAKNSIKDNIPEQAKSQVNMGIQPAAVKLLKLGFSVLPVNPDKTPACRWQE